MNDIWTNPSIARNQIIPIGIKSSIVECLNLSDTDNKTELTIFPGTEYKFTYFDSDTGKISTITGMVEKVYPELIKVKYLAQFKQDAGTKKCNNRNNTKCTDNLNFKYSSPTMIFIPISNIISVSSVCNKYKNSNKEGLYIMLLGVCATIVTAIIVRLAFIDDNQEEAIKYVNLEAGKIYDITYESCDGRIYENRVKVVSIEDKRYETGCTAPCANGYVRESNMVEHTGFNNAVYITDTKNKDDFMCGKPIKNGRIKIIVDTSEYFTGTYESIALEAIRDCTCVSDGSFDNSESTD